MRRGIELQAVIPGVKVLFRLFALWDEVDMVSNELARQLN
jgi:hypothetical protein